MRCGNQRALIILLLLPFQSIALNCGTQGSVYAIKEQDALVWIYQRLNQMEMSGEIAKLQQTLKNKALNSIERPKAVKGLTPTRTPKTFSKDLTVTVSEAIQDLDGRLIHPIGTKINPLANPLLRSNKVLIFFDADDKKQLNFALNEYNKHPNLAKLVLVNGPVLDLMRTHQIPFYFDQTGRLTRYFGFKQIPALVSQSNDHLLIQEVKIE